MARPTNAERLEMAHQRAVESIRGRLPELAKKLVDMALEKAKQKVQCPKCRHTFEIQTDGLKNPDLVLDLWTRAEGKPAEQKQFGDVERFAQLIGQLQVIQDQGEEPDGDNHED
jgi:hypothetical protein